MRKSVPLIQVLYLFLHHRDEKISGRDIREVTKISAGVLYPLLIRLEEQGWLISEWEDPKTAREQKRPRRHYYRITPDGVTYADELMRETLPTLKPNVVSEGLAAA